MLSDFNSLNNFFRVILHQHIISSNVGFALCGIDHQDFSPGQTGLNFPCGREPGAAHAGNPGLADDFNQILRRTGGKIRGGNPLTPLTAVIRGNDHTQFRQSGRVGDGALLNCFDGA
ncbi:hypothetical protein VQ7734_03228 [Vibrio quintilis]|uniref:Uncharacterized protein n=1 Tax=Vibrio quintilis TaxID=1117707 RepID=A0A1M7YXP6_9VIBR|nr:hypothetical protein VQ7734_03228 [Vibrio quintilis]